MQLRKYINALTALMLLLSMNSKPNIQSRVVEFEFSDPQLEILESTAQIKLFHAGVGSGKTHIIGADNLILAINYPHVRGFIGANTYSQLSKSTLVGVFKLWASFGIIRDVHYVVNIMPPPDYKIYGERLERYNNTISFKNGKLIFLASLENYQAIDGIEIAHAHLDETKDTPEEAVKEVILARLRQKGLWLDKFGKITTDESQGVVGYNPLSIFTSPAKVDWISEWFNFPKYFEEINATIFEEGNYFRKRIRDKLVIISSTYHNAHNLPAGYIESKLIEPNAHNQHLIHMLVYGSPLAKAGNEYYNTFDRMRQVKDVEMPNNIPVHIGFDFNRGPYITSGLYKVWYKSDVNRWHIHKFDEVLLPPPHNTTEHLANKLIELYGHKFTHGVFYYGDYSGFNKRTNSVEDDYDIIRRVLAKYLHNTSDRVIVNDRVVKRKEFMNKVNYGSLPIDFTMSPKCVKLIADFEFVKEGPDGKKLKSKDKDGNEKYGHTSDETEYVFTSLFEQYYNI